MQKRIQKFKQLLSLNCLERGVSSYDIINSNSIDIFKNIVIDKYFKGIGLLTNNNVFIRTIPFNLSSHRLDFINQSELHKNKPEFVSVLQTYKEINKNLMKNKMVLLDIPNKVAIMNQKTIHGLVDDDFNYIPVKDVDVSKVVISLEFINMKKPNKMIDNILNTQNNEKDERVKSVGSYIYENNLYVQLKNDLIHYLSNSGSDIINKLLIFRNNNGLLISKRESHLKIFI